MRAVGFATGVAVVALLTGCGGGGETSSGGLREAEIDWVAEYSGWAEEFVEELSRESQSRLGVLDGVEALGPYRDETAELRDCRGRLDERLGSPPTARLRPTLAGLRQACGMIAVALERLVRANDLAARTGPFLAAGEAVARASLRWSEVDAALDRLMLARRALPRLGGSATRSRVEPTLTRVAGEVADGRSVEVRCWSDDDWRRVLGEEEALTNGQMTVDTVGAFAIRSTGTVHLQQSDCATLGRLAYEGWEPRDSEGRDRLSSAVSTLSHEIQHIVSPADEAETECAAVQHNAEVAQALGASRPHAGALARWYWERLYPPDAEEYQSDECRPGGALDQAPETPAWPTG